MPLLYMKSNSLNKNSLGVKIRKIIDSINFKPLNALN